MHSRHSRHGGCAAGGRGGSLPRGGHPSAVARCIYCHDVALLPATVDAAANLVGSLAARLLPSILLLLNAVLESGKDLHGRFYSWAGDELPW